MEIVIFAQGRKRTLAWSFWLFVSAFAVLLVYKPQFGIIDDWQLLNTVLVGKHIPWFIQPSIGRFAPLSGQEINLVSIVSRSPFAFYLFESFELLLAAWLLVRNGQFASRAQQSSAPYVVAFCIMLLPGFTESWFRLCVQERSVFLCVAGLLFCRLKLRETQGYGFLGLGLLFAGIAVFCKETGFISVGAFGFFDLLLSGKSDRRSARRMLDLLLLSLCGVWLLSYYFFSYRFRGTYLYSARAGNALHALLRAFAATLLHDPLLVLLLALGAALMMRRQRRTDPLLQVCLCAIGALIAAYLALHMSNNYYLLPAYALVPFVACSILAEPRWKAVVRRPLVIGVFGLCMVNQAIVGVQQVTLWRTDPQQFQKILPILTGEIKESSEPRRSIFLAGVDAGNGIEFYTSLGTYLQNRGVSINRFDLKSAAPVVDSLTWMRIVSSLPNRDFSFEQTMVPQPVLPHDLVLVTAAGSAAVRQLLGDTSQYRCIYHTDAFSYPNLTLKRIARVIVTHGRPGVDDRIDPNYALYERL